jgi:small-conductance mechanosensitive channel
MASTRLLRPFGLPWFAALLFALLLGAGPARAQADDDADAALAAVRTELTAIQGAVRETSTDGELQRLRARAVAQQTRAADLATRLAPELAALQARLAQLGTPAPGAKEDADVASQRAQIAKDSAALEGELKLARLLAIEADQLAAQLWTQRRAQFQAQLGERTASILSRTFWSELRDDLPRDRERLAALGADMAEAAQAAPAWAWALALLAVLAALAASAWTHRRAIDWIAARVPSGRLRRSLHALVVLLLWSAAAGIAAFALRGVIDWDEHLAPDADALVDSIAGMLWFAGYLAGLAQALICANRPSWRLLPMPDAVANRLRALPVVLAATSLLAWVAEKLTALLNTSLALTVAVNCIVALALGLTLGIALQRAERRWRRLLRDDGALRRPLWLATIAVVSWLVLAGAVVCLLTGYVAFGSFAVKQVLWATILLGSAYVLAALIDDACMAWLAPPANAPAPSVLPTLSAATRSQAAVLVSGLLRIALALIVLLLLLAPFGEGPAELLRRSGQWQAGWSVGEVKLRPGALLQGLIVLVVGLALVRLLRGWLADRYLPTTTLDPGMRSSATTLFGYAGAVIAVATALSAIGIGLERVAWVASALSVGIGFGLQAVVQNFVSGLILLAERPVKVGDWVSLGGVEGDIRRINVRATEIQMGDRSTVIVPNSEFITKVVRNVTMAEPLGLVQIKLALPIAADAEQVRAHLLEAYRVHEDVLDAPAPNVLLDGIDGANLLFNATGFVASPRAVAGVRSGLLFDVLRRLREANITLAAAPTVLIRAPEVPPISAAAAPPEPPRTN